MKTALIATALTAPLVVGLFGASVDAAKPHPRPAPRHAPAAHPFTVKAWVSPDAMPYDAYPTLYVKSVPGATCSASIVYSTGRTPVSFDGYAQKLPASGVVQWSWHEETKGDGGTATVDCTYHGQERGVDASFSVG